MRLLKITCKKLMPDLHVTVVYSSDVQASPQETDTLKRTALGAVGAMVEAVRREPPGFDVNCSEVTA